MHEVKQDVSSSSIHLQYTSEDVLSIAGCPEHRERIALVDSLVEVDITEDAGASSRTVVLDTTSCYRCF